MPNANIVNLVLYDGTADGPAFAELANLKAVAYRIPKNRLSEFKDRDHLKQSGIYFLFGRDDDTSRPKAYVGQALKRLNGTSLTARIYEHNRSSSKNFCENIVFFTSTDAAGLGATDLCWLEHRFWEMASKAGRFDLVNQNEPTQGTVSEAKYWELERFAENARLLMKVLGYKVFEQSVQKAVHGTGRNTDAARKADEARLDFPRRQPELSPCLPTEFFLRHKTRTGVQFEARGVWDGLRFKLLKDSCIYAGESHGLTQAVRKLRSDLRAEGTLKPEGTSLWRLDAPQTFPEAAKAAEFVIGGKQHGRRSWKTKDGLNFRDFCKRNSDSQPIRPSRPMDPPRRKTRKTPPAPRSEGSCGNALTLNFVLRRKTHTGVVLVARGTWDGKKFTVLPNSLVLSEEHPGLMKEHRALRRRLEREGVLTPVGNGLFRLRAPQTFRSPSGAASFVRGGAVDGPKAWKTEDGRTFEEAAGKGRK